MKILIVRPFPTVVDLKNNSYNQQEIGLATAFKKMGNDVGIVYFSEQKTHFDKYNTSFGDIDIYYIKGKRILKTYCKFEKYDHIKKNYDLIISNEYNQGETFKNCRDYTDKTIIYHGPYYSPFKRKYNLFIKVFDFFYLNKYKRLQPMIVTKSKMAQEYLEHKGLNVSESVGVGLDLTQLHSIKESDFCNSIEKSKYNLLYIGILEERRNIIFMLELLKKLVEINHLYKLIIIGKGNANYTAKIFKYIDDNNLRNNVIYKERMPQNELRGIYLKAEYFLLPTSYEIWGMVLMEALYFGCKVITTQNGGSSSLIRDNSNGFIRNLDVNVWFDIINNEKKLVDDHKKYNENLIVEKYSWDNIAKKMITTIK